MPVFFPSLGNDAHCLVQSPAITQRTQLMAGHSTGLSKERREQMATYKLKRTGMAPLTFEGEELASVSGQYLHNRESNRWWELSVFRSDTGHHVLCVSFKTNWQGEVPHHEVRVCDSPTEVGEWLSNSGLYLSQVLSILGEHAERAAPALKHQLRWLVTDLCDELGDEFAEELQDQTPTAEESS
jgi:hypothetical protein